MLEALACDVPVLATPVGIHPEALHGVAGALCAPFELAAGATRSDPHLRDPDPRIAGRAHAEPFSAQRMAERVPRPGARRWSKPDRQPGRGAQGHRLAP